MERLQQIHGIVRQINRLLRSSVVRMRYMMSSIVNGDFSISEWTPSNLGDINTIRDRLGEYSLSIYRNNEIVNRIDGCLIRWRQMIDFCTENPLTSLQDNVYHVEGQILHLCEIIEVLEAELLRIEQLIAHSRITL